MGCFLQCFGLSTKRKRRKTLYKVLAAGQPDQKYATYEQVLAITEKSIIPYSQFRGRDEHQENNDVKSKKKKKVTFNLNLQIYEPNPNSYQLLDNEEEEESEDTTVEQGGEGSAALAVTFPPNHRYSNFRYDYDDDEEITYEESDIDDDDWDDDDDGSDESLENGEAEECALVSEASLNYSPRVLESNALQSKPLLQEIAVDASLSNWLVSPNYNVSTTIRCQ